MPKAFIELSCVCNRLDAAERKALFCRLISRLTVQVRPDPSTFMPIAFRSCVVDGVSLIPLRTSVKSGKPLPNNQGESRLTDGWLFD